MTTDKLNIAIIGSRTWTDFEAIHTLVAQFNPKTTRLYSGGALGADTIAYECAKRCGIECVVLNAEWDKHGRGAGIIRNGEIIKHVTRVYAFWDGESKGTWNMIERAMKANHIVGVSVIKAVSK